MAIQFPKEYYDPFSETYGEAPRQPQKPLTFTVTGTNEDVQSVIHDVEDNLAIYLSMAEKPCEIRIVGEIVKVSGKK